MPGLQFAPFFTGMYIDSGVVCPACDLNVEAKPDGIHGVRTLRRGHLGGGVHSGVDQCDSWCDWFWRRCLVAGWCFHARRRWVAAGERSGCYMRGVAFAQSNDSGPEQQDVDTTETCHVQELGRVPATTMHRCPTGDRAADFGTPGRSSNFQFSTRLCGRKEFSTLSRFKLHTFPSYQLLQFPGLVPQTLNLASGFKSSKCE